MSDRPSPPHFVERCHRCECKCVVAPEEAGSGPVWCSTCAPGVLRVTRAEIRDVAMEPEAKIDVVVRDDVVEHGRRTH